MHTDRDTRCWLSSESGWRAQQAVLLISLWCPLLSTPNNQTFSTPIMLSYLAVHACEALVSGIMHSSLWDILGNQNKIASAWLMVVYSLIHIVEIVLEWWLSTALFTLLKYCMNAFAPRQGPGQPSACNWTQGSFEYYGHLDQKISRVEWLARRLRFFWQAQGLDTSIPGGSGPSQKTSCMSKPLKAC